MTSGEGPEVPRDSFRYLLLGYFLILVGGILTILTTLGSFSRGNPNPITVTITLSINSLGFIIVVFFHLQYMRNKGHMSVLDKIFSTRIKYVVIFLTVATVTLGNFGFINDDIWTVPTPLPMAVAGMIGLATLVVTGIAVFNILFVLVGPVYILLFYFTVVRGSGASS